MANNYQGPPQDFAMVVPVPVVLGKKDVRVLPREIFDRVDKLAAPRLVEYWEQDPCNPRTYDIPVAMLSGAETSSSSGRLPRDLGVKIEAEFEVGEYQIVVLSAKESTGLDTWLRQENYNIPEGAQSLLEPYVQSGSKFFVAKVDATKVQFDAQGQTMLSPLRFHYDSKAFSLPVRLGLINAQGPQDLLVHVLARGVRYELANYENVAIPTNLEVKDEVRDRFGAFYASLFDHLIAQHPKAVVTEYAWSAASCDPCPEPAMTLEELVTLGVDVLPSYERAFKSGKVPSDFQWSIPNEFVLTRLHARYDASSLGEDLVFQAAPAIVGGREFMSQDGQLERGAVEEPGGYNNFQARYIIRHTWDGPIECDGPIHATWGGPWVGDPNGDARPQVAQNMAFAPRGATLADFVTESASAQLEADVGPLPAGPVDAPEPDPKRGLDVRGIGGPNSGEGGGCAHCGNSEDSLMAGLGTGLGTGAALTMFGLLGVRRRRRRTSKIAQG